MTPEDIASRFAYHAPDPERQEAHASMRAYCLTLAERLNEVLSEGREKSLAFTHLEEVMFWANAAIARQS